MEVNTKALAKGFIRWLIIVGLTFNVIVWGVIAAKCQELHPKHDSSASVEDEMGFISVTFMSKDDRLIYWKRETRHEIKLSSFGYDKYTKFEFVDKDKLNGRLCIIYCKTHMFAYLVTQCENRRQP